MKCGVLPRQMTLFKDAPREGGGAPSFMHTMDFHNNEESI